MFCESDYTDNTMLLHVAQKDNLWMMYSNAVVLRYTPFFLSHHIQFVPQT